jgi:hypothetical protein
MAAILRNPGGTVMSSFAGITSERSCSVRAVVWLKTPCGSSCRFRDQSCQTIRSGLDGVGNCASRYTPRASRSQFPDRT